MNDSPHYVTVGKRDKKDFTEIKRIGLNQFHHYRRLGFEKVPDEVLEKLRAEASAAAAKKKAGTADGGSKKKSKKSSKKGANKKDANPDDAGGKGGTE